MENRQISSVSTVTDYGLVDWDLTSAWYIMSKLALEPTLTFIHCVPGGAYVSWIISWNKKLTTQLHLMLGWCYTLTPTSLWYDTCLSPETMFLYQGRTNYDCSLLSVV